MLLETEGCVVNYMKWVGGLSQELSWPESNSQKPLIDTIYNLVSSIFKNVTSCQDTE